jgi:hypothetical protein
VPGFLLGLGKPAPDSDRINEKKDDVLDDERRFGLQPSAIHATDTTINIVKPATEVRAFTLAATRAAARTVVTAANVLRIG